MNWSTISIDNLTKRITLQQMHLKSVIAFVLLSLLSFNSLLSVTGGFLLRMHHDLSFHVSNDSHSDTESDATHSYTIEHEHHHHELKVIAEMDPAVRGVDPWSKVQVPTLGVLAYLSNVIDRKPVPRIARRFVARPPPDVLPQQLVTLRTQVLRL